MKNFFKVTMDEIFFKVPMDALDVLIRWYYDTKGLKIFWCLWYHTFFSKVIEISTVKNLKFLGCKAKLNV